MGVSDGPKKGGALCYPVRRWLRAVGPFPSPYIRPFSFSVMSPLTMTYAPPTKHIFSAAHLAAFQRSQSHHDILAFIDALNASVVGVELTQAGEGSTVSCSRVKPRQADCSARDPSWLFSTRSWTLPRIHRQSITSCRGLATRHSRRFTTVWEKWVTREEVSLITGVEKPARDNTKPPSGGH